MLAYIQLFKILPLGPDVHPEDGSLIPSTHPHDGSQLGSSSVYNTVFRPPLALGICTVHKTCMQANHTYTDISKGFYIYVRYTVFILLIK